MRIPKLLAAAALAALTASLSAAAFTGTIHYQLTDAKGNTHDLSLALSGGKVRSDISSAGHAMATIIDLKGHSVTTLMPERKLYRVGDFTPAKGNRAKLTATKTGATAQIAGYTAEEWTLVRNGRVTSMWMTSQLGRGFYQGDGPTPMDVPDAWKGKDLVLLRLTQSSGTKMEATKVDTSAPEASLFSVPAGYTQMQMPAGMGAAGAANPGSEAGSDAAARMQKAMESMTPAQRAAMQQYMGGGQ